MNYNTISLPRKLTNQLLHLALLSPDAEVCGLIGADSTGKPTSCYPINNNAPTPENRFFLDTRQQIAAMQQMRDKGESLFAIYHSHPKSPAIPSRIDMEDTSYPEIIRLIISLNTKGILALHAFLIADQNYQEIALNLIEA